MKNVAFIALLFCFTLAKAQIYSLTQYKLEDGLPSAYIYDITQDKKGFLMVATGEGLAVYDGNRFVNFDTTHGLGDNLISGISVNRYGNIAVGHIKNGISVRSGLKFENSQSARKNESPVSCLFYDDKKILFGTKSGQIGVFENNAIRLVELKGATFINKITQINNVILIATDNGLYKLQNEKVAALITITEGIHFTSLCSYSNGLLLAGSDSGDLYVYSVTTNASSDVKQVSVNKVSKNVAIKSIINTTGNSIMMGSWGNGIYTADIDMDSNLLKNQKNISDENGLSSLFVNVLYKDGNDNIWIGTFGGGLFKFNNNHFRVYNKKSGLYSNRVKAVLAHGNRVLVGLENGFQLLNTSNMDTLIVYNGSNKFVNDQVTSIALINPGAFLIGTENSGLFLFDEKRNTLADFFKRTGLRNPPKGINHVAVSKDSMAYISTLDGLFIYDFKRKHLKKLTTDQGLPHNNILNTFLDSDGRLWFVAPKAVPGMIQNDSIILFKDIPDFSCYNITSVCEGRPGNIYITTNGDGIYKYNRGVFTQYTSSDGLVSNYVLNAAYDRNKEMIICSHQNGFSVLDLGRNKIRQVSSKSNLNAFESSANSISIESSKVYFGTEQGLGVYLIDEEKTNCLPPRNSISRIVINKKVYSDEDTIINLPYASYDIQFDYIGIELTYPGEVRYTYKLDGLEKKFKTTYERHLEYTNVGEGEYTFILYSTNYLGIRNTVPLRIKIVVGQPIYKKWWFIGLLILTLALLVYVIVKLQTLKLIKQRTLLQEMVKKRTEQIVEINRDLETKNFSITSSIDYALRIQNVLLPEKEEIHRQLDAFIFHKPKDVVSGDFYWFYATEEYNYIAVVDCTGHGVPGAFMSIIGTFFLDQILAESENPLPSHIVTELDKRIVKSLRQYGRRDGVADGMDVALCRIDKRNSKVLFCGAHRPLYFVSNNVLTEYKSIRLSVGGFSGDLKKEFVDEIISYQKGDAFYIFSDGYGDQFGGKGNRRFSTKEMKLLFSTIYKNDTSDQLKDVERAFNDWITGLDQTDDVLVIGVKL